MTRTIQSPMGLLTLRPERAEDEEFRFSLFCQSVPDYDSVPLQGAQREQFLRLQFRAQTSGFRTQYPDADFAIIECEGERIGRSVIDRSGDKLNYIELLLVPQVRSRGVGSAVIYEAIREADAKGITMVFNVAIGNAAAIRLYQRIGFVETGRTASHVMMEWPGAIAVDR